MRRKMFTLLCLVMTLSFILSSQAFAVEPTSLPMQTIDDVAVEEIAPFWSNIQSFSANLDINNGAARMSGVVIAVSGSERITVTAVLERINTNGTATHIATFSTSDSTSTVWSWERTHHVARGHDYRLTLTASVIRNGFTETVSLRSRTVRAN